MLHPGTACKDYAAGGIGVKRGSQSERAARIRVWSQPLEYSTALAFESCRSAESHCLPPQAQPGLLTRTGRELGTPRRADQQTSLQAKPPVRHEGDNYQQGYTVW